MSTHHHHNHHPMHTTSNQEVRVPTTRKRRRGMIEKRRRDKINNSLAELRRLVPTANEKQNSSKLEKAEILQLTVDYLRSLHAQGIIADSGISRMTSQSSDSNQTDSTATVISSTNNTSSTLLASPDMLLVSHQLQQQSLQTTNIHSLDQNSNNGHPNQQRPNHLITSPQPSQQLVIRSSQQLQQHSTANSTSPSQASSLSGSDNIHDSQTLTSLHQYSAAAAAAAALSTTPHQNGLSTAPVDNSTDYLTYPSHHHHAQLTAAAYQQQHQHHHGQNLHHHQQNNSHQHYQASALNGVNSRPVKMDSHHPFQSPLVLQHSHPSLLNLDHHQHHQPLHQNHHHNSFGYGHNPYHNATFSATAAASPSATN